jgi:hypothetical protein
MSNKRIVWALLIATMPGISTTVTPVQAANAQPVAKQELVAEQETQDAQRRGGRRSTAIVGAWLVTLGGAAKALHTFNADGTFNGSVQGEVSTTSPLGSHTLQHGVWRHLGGRRFALTFRDIFYDIHTGQLNAFGKVSSVLTLDREGDEMSAEARVQIVDPNGNVLVDRAGTASYQRIKFERPD